jgi:methyl-accepting chemotaxis protein
VPRGGAARAPATARVMSDFDEAVGGIVRAAMAGDFSQRVPLDGKDGVMRNLASSLNTMCDTLGKAFDDVVRVLSALSEGDLTQRITAEYEGNFGVLKDNANKTAERIGAAIADVKAATREVTNASSEISTSTTDLSQRTEEQAASLEQTSASMEEMAATVKKNAENAQHANESAANAREVANRGGEVVAKAVEAMGEIEGSSRKISDIIGVIDEIARQTNLLALNAAVEAARAGEAGRGFAVVASEVRNLAQRSSQAAKDIKDLIISSNGQVQGGVELVNKAGSALAEIVDSINKVAHIVADIATASSEQATGIEQVNKALTQMDEVTQQNSALVEENAATAKTLDEQANAMSERLSFFRVGDEGEGAVKLAQRSQAAKPQPKAGTAKAPQAMPARQRVAANGGPVGRMQASLAAAVNADQDWKEF